MNNKSCGCSKAMPVRPMARMPKGMMSKPVCDTCRAKEWSCGEEKCNMMENKQMGSCGCKEACAPCEQKDRCDRCNQPCGRMREARPCARRMPERSCCMEMPEARPCGRRMPEQSCCMGMPEARPCCKKMPECSCRMTMPTDTCGCNKGWGDNCQEDYMDVIVKKYGCKCNERKYSKCDNRCEMEFGEAVDVLPLGMGYVPFQEWDCNVSNACQGLYDGTIFPELVKPFVCTYCYEEGSCR